MLQANVESFRNLEENLAEMGLSSDTLPLVLQYNKRDLADICTVEEMNAALNRHDWPWFEASAVTGAGVFETLKGISRQTLMALKKRLGRSEPAPAPAARQAPAAAARPAVAPGAPATPAAPPAPPPRPAAAPPVQSGSYPQVPAAPGSTAAAAPPRPAAPVPPPAAKPAAPPAGKRTVDVLSELEKLRSEAMRQPAPPLVRPPARPPAAQAAPGAPGVAVPNNGRGELSRTIEMTLRKSDFKRARRFIVSFQVEDDQHQVMDAVRDLQVEIKDAPSLEKLLLRLNIALNAKE